MAPKLFKSLPGDALVRMADLVSRRGTPGIVPVGRSTWLKLVHSGKAPQPYCPFGPRTAFYWRVSDVRDWLRGLTREEAA